MNAIVCKEFPDKVYASKAELFEDLRENVDNLIAIKKAEVQKSFEKSGVYTGFLLRNSATAVKAGLVMKDDYIYPVINTTRYMDSHRDVHFDGIWTKTVKDQAGKLFYVTDHEVKIETVIAWPEDVHAMVKTIPWAFVGKDYSGTTEALIYEIPKAKIVHDKARRIIEEKRPVQNSVCMMYVKIKLAINSEEEENKQYKAYYDSRIGEIANRDQVEALGYFWGIEEAKILTEGSMVLRGSNDATAIQQKNIEPDTSTQKQNNTKAADRTLVKKELKNLLNLIKA